MNRALVPQSVVSWLFCVLVVGLPPITLGQQPLPRLFPVSVSDFTIPFEMDGSAHSVREIELLVSKDRGRSWQFVARQPVESGKFAFRADTDGEYWFAFRTVTSTGSIGQMRVELRVLVNTGNPAAAPPPQASATQSPTPNTPPTQSLVPNTPAAQSPSLHASESRPILPPRPERFLPANMARPQTQPQPMQLANAEEPKTGEPARTSELVAAPERINVARPGEVLAPRFPGVAQNEPDRKREGDLLDDLLSGMSPFMDVQPAVRSVPSSQVATDRSTTTTPPNVPDVLGAPRPPSEAPAGSISYIGLNVRGVNDSDTRPRIVVMWHTGPELLRGAQIDVLRVNAEGQRTPIAINLENNGEYWWYLSPEDLKPFYVEVRIRSLHGGISVDATRDQITIDPQQLAMLQSQRP